MRNGPVAAVFRWRAVDTAGAQEPPDVSFGSLNAARALFVLCADAVKRGETFAVATAKMKMLSPGRASWDLPPGSIKIGRADDNDIVLPEMLASRHHATLIPTPTAPKSGTTAASTAPSSTAPGSTRPC